MIFLKTLISNESFSCLIFVGTRNKEGTYLQGMEAACQSPKNQACMDARENKQALCKERENREYRVNTVSLICPENRGSFISFRYP